MYALSNYLKVFAELFFKKRPAAVFLLKALMVIGITKYSTFKVNRAFQNDFNSFFLGKRLIREHIGGLCANLLLL